MCKKHIHLVSDMTGDKTGDLVGLGDQQQRQPSTSPANRVLKGYNAVNWHVDKCICYLANIPGPGQCDT